MAEAPNLKKSTTSKRRATLRRTKMRARRSLQAQRRTER
jgi:hypothetical protein